MSNDEDKNVCSLDNEIIKELLTASSTLFTKKLKNLIDGYYEIYNRFLTNFELLKQKLISDNNVKEELIYRNAFIENVKVLEKDVYFFEFVSNYPVKFRIAFEYNVHDEKLDYRTKNYASSHIAAVLSDESVVRLLAKFLEDYVKVKKAYLFDLKNIPYMVSIDFNHIAIIEKTDTSNNIIPLVDMNLDDFSISFSEKEPSDEFAANIRDYLILLLENADVSSNDVTASLGYINAFTMNSFVRNLLIKNEIYQEPVKKDIEEIVAGNEKEIYLYLKPDGEYRKIIGYKKVTTSSNGYVFEFRDGSSMTISSVNIIKLARDYCSLNSSEAMVSFKKLILDKEKEQ